MDEFEIVLESEATADVRHRIIGGLVAFNDAQAGDALHRHLAVVARRSGEIVGGLLSHTSWEWLFIAQVWVEDAARGRGVGRRLVEAAESEAIRRGCRHAHVDTFSFQARPFYERQGYTVFGELPDYPSGHTRYFLQKRELSQSAAG